MSEGKLIKIGNQTAFSASTPTEPFEYAVDSGFNAFEWFPDRNKSGSGWDESDIDAETRRYIRETAIEKEIILSVHVSWEFNPLKLETHEILFKSIEFAQDIGAFLLNIHLYADEGIKAYVKAIMPVIKHTAEIGIKLSIENTPLTGPEDFNRMFTLLRNQEDLETNHIGMCLDIGHANIYDSTHNDYLEFIDRLDPQVPIIHIHLHENYGDSDRHLPIFTGPSKKDIEGLQGFLERIINRRFSGSIILEQWPEPHSLLNDMRDRLYYMLDSILGTAQK